MQRTEQMTAWLATQLPVGHTLTPLADDGSSRRYFRVTLADGSTRVVMDAPPTTNDCRPFVAISALLKPAVRVPGVLAHDLENGFLLLEDAGEQDLLTVLKAEADEQKAQQHYRAVIDSLLALQQVEGAETLPDYDAATMSADLDRFAEWYAARHLEKPLVGEDLRVWERCRALLVMHAQSQGKVLIHFDFHSRNLMAGDPPAVLDFQDARRGPISYDLVCLLKDMYIQWPEDFRLDLCIRYWEKARSAGLPVPDAFDTFYAQFELMGVFRHIRSLGTFARLVHRDGKTKYIDDMPVALDYLRETCARYGELHPLYKLINRLTGFVPGVGYTF
ncbi:MAG: phosphotransferase [Burkholderiales bacterium]|nr:phosphotransferase [Burkholderiales bacterium]